MAESLHIIEYDGEPSLTSDEDRRPHWEYAISSSGTTEVRRRFQRRQEEQHTTAWLHHYLVGVPKQVLTDLFMPLGYPQSVRKEYMGYQICDSVQGLCSYLRGVVATSAVLAAAGVGDAEATAMSAAMTWAMRDGLGMIGGLTYSYYASSLFDSYTAEFRLFADIINDVGLTLDMLAPYFGSEHVLYVTSVAMICKIMCGISAGATKGSITQHFCLRGNMADLNAKEGTQETLVSLMGMIMGILLAKYLHKLEEQTDKEMASRLSWIIFNTLTIIHVWVNYIGVKLLRLRTLNNQRAQEALKDLVNAATKNVGDKTTNEWADAAISSIPSPDDVKESLIASTRNMLFPSGVILGSRLGELTKVLSIKDLSEQVEQQGHYILGVSDRNVYVSLLVDASDEDQLTAFVHASIVLQCIRSNKGFDIVKDTRRCVKQLASSGLSLKCLEKKGWDVKDRLYVGFGRYRLQLMKPKDQ